MQVKRLTNPETLEIPHHPSRQTSQEISKTFGKYQKDQAQRKTAARERGSARTDPETDQGRDEPGPDLLNAVPPGGIPTNQRASRSSENSSQAASS
jgi:hypothetical protein